MNRKLLDVGISLAVIAAAGLIFWDSLRYRPGTYDPLGSGTMPRMVAVAVIALCLVAIAQTLLGSPAKRGLAEEVEDFERRPWLAVAIFGYLVAAAILVYLAIPFGIVGSLLLFASTLSIKKGERAIVLPAAACSVAFGFGLSYLFGSVFGVDLP